MIQVHEAVGGVAAGVQERGGQAVGALERAAVGAGDAHLGFDDPHRDAADDREVGGVGERLQDRWAAALADAAQDLCAGGVHGGEEVVAVKAPVPQHQHLGAQMVQQPGGVGGLALPGGPEDRSDHGPGAGLDQRHQLDLGIPAMWAPPQPLPVALAVRHLDRAAVVE